jgi:hypothetical protein
MMKLIKTDKNGAKKYFQMLQKNGQAYFNTTPQ